MNIMGEVSDEIHNKILSVHSNDRIIITKHDSIDFKPTPNQEISFKPKGLWYGIGDSWIRWVKSEMPDWDDDNVFKIDIDENKILRITNYEELVAFEEKYNAMRPEDRTVRNYSAMMAMRYRSIDWGMVAKDYAGIEIAPYIHKARYTHMWYYGWDVASGCIWGDGVITNITKLNDDAPSLNEDTFSGTHVWNHIKSITPNQDDIPWGFSKKIKNAEFENVSNFNLYSLLETDPDFKEYYESGDERYSDDEVDPSDIDNEIVVVNGELLDGYSRAATLLRSGAETTNAFVGKVDGHDVQSLDEYIRKIGDDKWRVYSEKGKNLGTYNSEAGAKKRLQQVHYFKNKG